MPPTKRKLELDGSVDLVPLPSELDDVAKLQFTGKAVRAGSSLFSGSAVFCMSLDDLYACIQGHDFSSKVTIVAEVAKAIEWVVMHSAEQVTALRVGLFCTCGVAALTR